MLRLESLRHCGPYEICEALKTPPISLDETYEHVLQRIPKEKQKNACRLFHCLMAAIRPLSVEEVGQLFSIDFDAGFSLKGTWKLENPDFFVLSTSTLITIIKNKGSKIVQFSHPSVEQFLTSDRLRTSEIYDIRFFHTTLVQAHATLAQACLSVLLTLDENMDKTLVENFPLASYAARYWVKHSMHEDVAFRFEDGIKRLFNPSEEHHLSLWTWIHNIASDQVQLETPLEERPTRPEATALHYAALCGFSFLVKYLVTHGANVNTFCGNHGTPLHAAAYKGHVDAVHILVAHGADVNAQSGSHAATPLYRASESGHLEIVQILLNYGADAHIRAQNDQTPFQVARLNGHIGISQLLLKCGAGDKLRIMM